MNEARAKLRHALICAEVAVVQVFVQHSAERPLDWTSCSARTVASQLAVDGYALILAEASRKQPSNSPASMPETRGEVSLQYPGPVRIPLISSGMLMALSTTCASPVSAAIHSPAVNTLPVRGLTGLPEKPLKP